MTLRNAVFQVHWLLGITAGLVLALVGLTGGILSFEDELLRALNPGVLSVEARDGALPPSGLVARVREQRADPVASLQLSSDPSDVAVVGFAPKPGERRGERRQLDPYTGALLPEPRYQGFFRTTMQLHRWLAADDVGKQVVAASTVALVFFCLSGLYLRWPRRWGSLRTWLALDWRQKGRNFLWHLHSVVGTWVLLGYLVMALTGLWWSYGWYREAVNDWAASGTVEVQAFDAPADRGAPPPFDVDAAWRAFQAQAPAWSEATLSFPGPDDSAIEVRYLDASPAHERARNTLALDRWTLAPASHDRYDDGTWRQKVGASMFALHRGSFFGLPGTVLFMLASLAMPLFAVTGWMLYLDRRGRRRAARVAATAPRTPAIPASAGSAPPQAVLVLHASQTGTAERLAWQTAADLRSGGLAVEVMPLTGLDVARLAATQRAIFVASTFGEAQAPDAARATARRLAALPPDALDGVAYAILALGDRDYREDFCGFGRALDQWLHHAGATPLFDRVDVDAGDPDGALRHWQHHIGLLAGRHDLPDWSPPRYGQWRIAERRILNAGSPGAEVFSVALVPEAAGDLAWQAGDIAEIHPGPLVDGRPTLPHREYSIASVPADGSLHLLVRRMRHPDGTPGLGSQWLADADPATDRIALRIRANPGFHLPAGDRPLVLVGNGTGIAGLRALLKARIAAGHRRNWLLFGERTRAHDLHYGDDLARWEADGWLQRLDLAFSREQRGPDGGPRYVQHLVASHADVLRAWVGDGASIYVCGSLAGMAPGVDAALAGIVGPETLEAMAADGRYRRDVY